MTRSFMNFYEAAITKGNSAWWLHRFEPRQSVGLSLDGEVAGMTSLDDNRWHHVAGVFDGRQAFLCLDGRLEDKAVVFFRRIEDDRTPVWITYNTSQERFFMGCINDVRIFGAALSRKEIGVVYSGKELRSPPKPMWLFERMAGNYPVESEHRLPLVRVVPAGVASGKDVLIPHDRSPGRLLCRTLVFR